LIMARARRRNPEGGFTLAELLLVLAIMGILMGVVLGYTRRLQGGARGTLAVVRARLSAARNTAVVSGTPSWVRIFHGKGARGDTCFLQWTTASPLLYFSFEEGPAGWGGWKAELLGGKIVSLGRFGNGLVHDRAGEPGIRVSTGGRDDLMLDRGFSARVDVKPRERRTMVLFKWGMTFSLELDERGVPGASLTLRGNRNLPGETVQLSGEDPLPLGTWSSLELLMDGRGAWLLVDGQVTARAKARGKPYYRLGEPIFLSGAQAPLAGVMDEVRLLALDAEPPEALPEGVEWTGGPSLVRFVPGGALDPALHPKGVILEFRLPGGQKKTVSVTSAGVVE